MGTNPRKRTSFCTPLRTTVRRSRGWLERSSPMMMSFRSGNCCSFCSSLFSAENASMMRTTFLCGRIAPAYRMKRIVHQIALGNQFAVRVGGMAAQKALVNRVVHHLDARIGNRQQLFDFVLGELRHRNHARRLAQHAPRQVKVQAAPQTGSVARSIHVLQQIVHGQNIRTAQPARNPEQVRNVNHVALQAPHNRPEIEIPFERVIARRPAPPRGSSAAARRIPPPSPAIR